jgi:hypothetical protein
LQGVTQEEHEKMWFRHLKEIHVKPPPRNLDSLRARRYVHNFSFHFPTCLLTTIPEAHESESHPTSSSPTTLVRSSQLKWEMHLRHALNLSSKSHTKHLAARPRKEHTSWTSLPTCPRLGCYHCMHGCLIKSSNQLSADYPRWF